MHGCWAAEGVSIDSIASYAHTVCNGQPRRGIAAASLPEKVAAAVGVCRVDTGAGAEPCCAGTSQDLNWFSLISSLGVAALSKSQWWPNKSA